MKVSKHVIESHDGRSRVATEKKVTVAIVLTPAEAGKLHRWLSSDACDWSRGPFDLIQDLHHGLVASTEPEDGQGE